MSPCTPFRLPGGGGGFVCTRGPRMKKCAFCSHIGTKLCDFPVGDGKTCDKPMCAHHAKSVGPDLDHCPEHAGRKP